jgi:hypothetical protein
MELIWLAPVAWVGLITLALPIAIHLLTKQETPLLRFPTLRFIRPTRLAALRRRRLQDLVLLAVRLAVLVAATAALATPVFVAAARQEQWRSRLARAVVIAPSASDRGDDRTVVRSEQSGSFVSAVFRPSARAADGIRDAAMWLDRQPPASREIVIVGTLREGSLSAADIALAPRAAGIRFVPLDVPAAPREVDFRLLRSSATLRARTTLLEQSTRIAIASDPDATRPIAVLASPDDQAFASAALDAALARGVRLPLTAVRSVRVVFAGASIAPELQGAPPTTLWMREALAQLPEVDGAQAGDTLIVRTPIRANNVEAVRLLARLVQAVYADEVSGLEPNVMSPGRLARWSRPVGFDPATPADEGDRRWFWGLALVLLSLEALLRRSQSAAKHERSEPEARVA